MHIYCIYICIYVCVVITQHEYNLRYIQECIQYICIYLYI